MTDEAFTTAEKIQVVEDLLQSFRHARGTPDNPVYHIYAVLKAVALDLRATTPEGHGTALSAIAPQIDRARRTKARIGYMEAGNHQAIAEAVLAHWPAVRQALMQIEESETTT